MSEIIDGLNLGLSLLNNWQNRKFAREQATTAYNRQVALWQMENEYNSPANQMQRFIDAGLNPNLAYGQLQNGLGAPSVPQGNAANQSDPQLLLQNQLIDAQIKSLDAKTANETAKTDQDIRESLSRMGVNDANAQYLTELCKTVPVSITQMEYQIQGMSLKQREMGYDLMTKAATWSPLVQQIQDNARITHAQAENYGSFLAASMLGLRAQASRDFAAAKLNKEQAEVASALANLYSENAYAQSWINDKYYGRDGTSYFDGNKSRSYAQYDLFQKANMQTFQAQYQQKLTGLLQKYGDKEHNVGLIKAYTSMFNDLATPIIGGFNAGTRRMSLGF